MVTSVVKADAQRDKLAVDRRRLAKLTILATVDVQPTTDAS